MLDIDLQLKKGSFRLHVVERLDNPGFTVIQGRSGCGKTTLLRCIAGLEPGVRGRLTVAGTHWQGPTATVPPHRRSLGYVPQEPTLFPHKSVRDNLLFGFNRLKPRDRKLEFDHLVALLELAPLLERQPDQLSGGQKQRVAMGRALLTSPQLLLMDEPLASLDQQSKNEILPYLDRLTATLSIPVIYVTHSPQESARLADTLWIMDSGKVVRRGPAKRLLTALESEDSHRADACARIDGQVLRHQGDYGLTWVEVQGQELAVPHLRHDIGDRVSLQIDARDVSIALSRANDSSIVNLLDAQIEGLTVDRDPAYTIIRLAVGSEVLLARITSFSARRLGLNRGMQVIAQIKAVTL